MRQQRHDRRVEATREQRSDRDVRSPQAEIDAALHHLSHRLTGGGVAEIGDRRSRQPIVAPVASGEIAAVAPPGAGLELRGPCKRCVGRGDVRQPEEERYGGRVLLQRALRERLDSGEFGGEGHPTRRLVDEKRLLAVPIAHEQERPVALVVQGEGEHALRALEEVHAVP